MSVHSQGESTLAYLRRLARSESVQGERSVWFDARLALDEARSLNDARRMHPDPLRDGPRGAVVHLRERDDRQVRLIPRGPMQCRCAEFGRVSMTGTTVTDCPTELEHLLPVDFEETEAAPP